MTAIIDNLPKSIGKPVEKAFPQDRIGTGVYVRVGSKSKRVLEVITYAEAVERDVYSGPAQNGSEWVVPYCLGCGEPILHQLIESMLCVECWKEPFKALTNEGDE